MNSKEQRLIELTVLATLEELIKRADLEGEWEMAMWLQTYLATVTATVEG